MARFKAIKKGYYGDVIHDPDTDRHVYFDAPDDLVCTWAVKVDGADEPVAQAPADQEPDELPVEIITEDEPADVAVDDEF